VFKPRVRVESIYRLWEWQKLGMATPGNGSPESISCIAFLKAAVDATVVCPAQLQSKLAGTRSQLDLKSGTNS